MIRKKSANSTHFDPHATDTLWAMIETQKPKLLGVGPMARRLRVPVKWLRTEAEAGRVPHVRAGRVLLFLPKAVEDELVSRAGGTAKAASDA